MLHVGTRTCSRCRVEKPLNRHHFYRRTRDPFGYQRMCIASTRADLDRADAARRQARQAARAEALRAEQAAAVGGPFGYYPPLPTRSFTRRPRMTRRTPCTAPGITSRNWCGSMPTA
jgi:hypothetical protein